MNRPLIELDEAERCFVLELLGDVVLGGPADAQTVDSIVDGINKIRLGDPVGTIRRNGRSQVYERRESTHGTRYWQQLIEPLQIGGQSALPQDPDGISEFEVIYLPPGGAS